MVPASLFFTLTTRDHRSLRIIGRHLALLRELRLDVPEFPLEGAVLTSMVSRGRVFFIGLDIDAQAVKSVAIDITKKVTEFMFKEKGSKNNFI